MTVGFVFGALAGAVTIFSRTSFVNRRTSRTLLPISLRFKARASRIIGGTKSAF